MREIEIIKELMKESGIERELTFKDAMELYKRVTRAAKYYWEQKDGKEEENGTTETEK